MRRVRFGRTGVDVPAVSLGTWGHGGAKVVNDRSVGWAGHDDTEARGALKTAFERGIDHWDTADVYGDGQAEELIGTMWDEVPRDAIFLASKVGWDSGDYDHYYHPRQMRRQLERSLEKLRVDVIDLYYLHHCDFGDDDEYFDDAIAAMRKFRDEGKIRFIGLSDWNLGKIMRFIDRADPDAVQPFRNVVDDDYEESGLKRWVDEHDVGVAFFSPIKHGLLLGKYDAPQEFPEGDFRRNIEEFRDPAFIARMKSASAALRQKWLEHPEPVLHGVLGALLSDTPTGCVLLGQRNPRQARAAAAVGDVLSPDDAAWVRAQYAG